jgi:3-deoxy-D-manno-octulosonic-acid transferase
MALSPLIAAYLATVNPTERGMVGPETPQRPAGAVIWTVCADETRLAAVRALAARLVEDGELVTVLASLPQSNDPNFQITPNTKAATRAFIGHWKPDIVVWFGGVLDASTIFEINKSETPILLVEAKAAEFDLTAGRRVPGLMRSLFSSFSEILALDAQSAARIARFGVAEDKLRTTGPLEDSISPPSYNEAERADISLTLGSRPKWFAAHVPLNELSSVCAAHRHAARRAHMTLLILCPRNASDEQEIVTRLRADGLTVACREAEEQPRDATQVYVVGPEEGIGLWCRLAPITYLGGSLSDGLIPDPFSPATVGSAVLVGPHVNTHKAHYDRLLTASALNPFDTTKNFGPAVEALLATDLAAQLALNAWDATSRGADATNQLVSLVYKYLDGTAY